VSTAVNATAETTPLRVVVTNVVQVLILLVMRKAQSQVVHRAMLLILVCRQVVVSV